MDVITFIAQHGGTVAIAKRLDIARTTVSDWKRMNRLPGNRIPQVHAAFSVSLEDVVDMAKPRLILDAATSRQHPRSDTQ